MAYGWRSLESNTTGSNNTAIGTQSLRNNETGLRNTAVGYNADVLADGLTNATAIGADAKVGCSNCLVLGNNVKVGIGTSSPLYPLNFADALGDKISLWGNLAGNHYGVGIQSGLLQIHTDLISSHIAFGYGSSAAFTENMRIQGNGHLIVRGSITANSSFYTSDSRFKTNIEPINDALNKITQLNGYHYTWSDPQQDQSLQSGIIAQEVQQLFPELVKSDDKGYLSVNYIGLVPYLIQSVKQQQKKLDAMQQQIDELRKILKN